MAITFVQKDEADDDILYEVLVGPLTHGIIQRCEGGKYGYSRLIGNKVVPRHESQDLEELKGMIKEIP
ncbi:MAG: hypothetical protein ABW165_14820 [Candidatus Thiodiazotropha sp.]